MYSYIIFICVVLKKKIVWTLSLGPEFVTKVQDGYLFCLYVTYKWGLTNKEETTDLVYLEPHIVLFDLI